MHTNVPNVDTIMMMNARMVLMFEFFIMSFNCRFGLQRFRKEFDISKQWEKNFQNFGRSISGNAVFTRLSARKKNFKYFL